MKLYLLPISTRRTLLFCQRLPSQTESLVPASSPPVSEAPSASLPAPATASTPPALLRETLMDRTQARVASLWGEWERKPPGTWQHRVVAYGDIAFRRIAFEEWGLKSVPPLSWRRRLEAAVEGAAAAAEAATAETAAATATVTKTTEAAGKSRPAASSSVSAASLLSVEIIYPPSLLPTGSVAGMLQKLSTEREALHRKRLLWCFVGMPISAPFALIPLVPNLPFFYLAYRAWSHWRAISGGSHIQYLLNNPQLLTFSPSAALDKVYAREKAALEQQRESAGSAEELLLPAAGGGKALADELGVPQLELELDRAVWQVEMALQKEQKKREQPQEQAENQEPADTKPGTPGDVGKEKSS